MQGKLNLVTIIDDYSNPYIENKIFCFHDLDLDPMTLVRECDDLLPYQSKVNRVGVPIPKWFLQMALSDLVW